MMISRRSSNTSWTTCLFLCFSFFVSNTFFVPVAANDVCLMVYQMADNDLEYFIRNDNQELINSCAVRQKSLKTWVYFDGRLQTGSQEDIKEPLVNLYEQDGSLVKTKYTGSRYLTYSHSMKKMIVDTKLGELNGDHPETVFNFVQHALLNCIADGADEYILVFSSHGGGFDGFGGDDDTSRNRRQLMKQQRDRHLQQENYQIRNALEQVLAKTPGAPAKFDVIGFDACLMSSLTAFAEYSSVTKYYIASEATEPGHGWAYEPLCNVNTALDLAKDIHDNFLLQRQGTSHHAPKTLALMESTNFDIFHTAMENLADELTRLLKAENDPDFFALLQRSRASSISFDSVLDNPGTEAPSAIDIGSFFQNLDFQCNPKSNTQLRRYLNEAISTYNAMFIKRGNGPGTPDATGMHVMWPFKRKYKSEKYYFDQNLFDDPNVVSIAPKWFTFVTTYLASVTPTIGEGSVCSKSAVGSYSKDDLFYNKDDLFYNPKLYQTTNRITVTSGINVKVDYVFTEYGIDGSEYLHLDRSRGVRRQLGGVETNGSATNSPKSSTTLRSLYNRIEKSEMTTASSSSTSSSDSVPLKKNSEDREWRRSAGPHVRHNSHNQRSNRKTLADDYLILYGGSVGGSFDESSYRAVWDKKFYAIGDIDNFTPIYMRDEGESSYSIPVFYFPNRVTVTSSMFDYDTTPEEVVAMGGIYGAVEFGINDGGTSITAFTLMTSVGERVSETPPSAGGSIVPILYVEGQVGTREYWELIGGVDGTVLEWSEEQKFDLFVMNAEQYWDIYGLRASEVVIDMWAFDLDTFDADKADEGFELHSFYIDTDDTSIATKPHWIASMVVSGVLSVFVSSYYF